MSDRLQTHDAELNILKSVLERQSFDGALLRGIKGNYFRDGDYGAAWEYMREHYVQFGKVPDASTFFIDHPGIQDLVTKARAPEPPEFYGDKILEAYSRKGVAEKLRTALPKLQDDPEDGMEAIVDAVSEFRIIRNNIQILTLANTGRERLDAYEQATVYGIPFGWDTLDDTTLGAHPGDLGIVAARPGSWQDLANPLRRARRLGVRLPGARHRHRGPRDTRCSSASTPSTSASTTTCSRSTCSPPKRSRATRASCSTRTRPRSDFQIVNGTGMTPSALGSLIDQAKPDIVFIDSVHKLEPDKKYGTERWLKMSNLANELKDNVAQRYNVPVITNTHFNRDVGSSFGKNKNIEGALENVAGGDEWGKVADLVLGMSKGQEEIAQNAIKFRIIKGRESEDGKPSTPSSTSSAWTSPRPSSTTRRKTRSARKPPRTRSCPGEHLRDLQVLEAAPRRLRPLRVHRLVR